MSRSLAFVACAFVVLSAVTHFAQASAPAFATFNGKNQFVMRCSYDPSDQSCRLPQLGANGNWDACMRVFVDDAIQATLVTPLLYYGEFYGPSLLTFLNGGANSPGFTAGFTLSLTQDGRTYRLLLSFGTSSQVPVATPIQASTIGTWHSICIQAQSNTFSFSVDGVATPPTGTVSLSGMPANWFTTAGSSKARQLVLGAQVQGNQLFFFRDFPRVLAIDDFRLFTTHTANAFSDYYNNGCDSPSPDDSTIESWVTFDRISEGLPSFTPWSASYEYPIFVDSLASATSTVLYHRGGPRNANPNAGLAYAGVQAGRCIAKSNDQGGIGVAEGYYAFDVIPPGDSGPQSVPGATGPTGDAGPTGPVGDTGAVGSVGPAGVTSDKGQKGAQGPQGVQGTTGAAGSKGVKGAKGAAGVTGPKGAPGAASTGPIGSVGPAGLNGEQGDLGGVGPVGDGGVVGSVGPKGQPGVPGATGADGSQGIKGIKGAQGLPGDTGAKGVQGVAGATGPQGDTGTAGAAGATGSQGFAGATGAKGQIGPKGAPGDTGIAGDTGSRGQGGDTGLRGQTGPQGAQGVPGATGIKGIKGAIGSVGPAGDQGDMGPIGTVGPKGVTGPTGPKGAQGDKGISGVKGLQGDAGVPGATGPQGQSPQGIQGSVGPTGFPGQTGPLGMAGPTGAPGDTGVKGNKGLPGPTGTVGPAGDTGAKGQPGAVGAPGSRGPTGTTGPAGDTGATGPAGATGPSGAPGAAGPTGLQGPTGPDGATGSQGSRGKTGAKGVPGPDGEQGAAGPAGEIGPDGSVGATGSAGPKGDKGEPGLAPGGTPPAGDKGPKGLRGSVGPVGATGAPGAAGEAGAVGARGPNGLPGDSFGAGAIGSVGPAGAAGDKGAAGLPGDTGVAGVKGAQGVSGARGDQGTAGSAGPGGDKGIGGATGPKGDAGSKGVAGSVGPAGAPGVTGVRGAPGPTGAQGIAGTQGPQGPKGDSGPKGVQGPAGPVGPQGAAGPAGDAGAPGTIGPAGRKGPTGRTGVIGSVGPAGDAGDTGPAGSTTLGGLKCPVDTSLKGFDAQGGLLCEKCPCGTSTGAGVCSSDMPANGNFQKCKLTRWQKYGYASIVQAVSDSDVDDEDDFGSSSSASNQATCAAKVFPKSAVTQVVPPSRFDVNRQYSISACIHAAGLCRARVMNLKTGVTLSKLEVGKEPTSNAGSCSCTGGVSSVTLVYTGYYRTVVWVTQQDGRFTSPSSFWNVKYGDELTVSFSSAMTSIKVYSLWDDDVTFRLGSCTTANPTPALPISSGSFQIVRGLNVNKQALCIGTSSSGSSGSSSSSSNCNKCRNGKLKRLVVSYNGEKARHVQATCNGETLFSGVVAPGAAIPLQRSSGTFTAPIVLNSHFQAAAAFDPSCSTSIAVGLTNGDFVVTSAKDDQDKEQCDDEDRSDNGLVPTLTCGQAADSFWPVGTPVVIILESGSRSTCTFDNVCLSAIGSSDTTTLRFELGQSTGLTDQESSTSGGSSGGSVDASAVGGIVAVVAAASILVVAATVYVVRRRRRQSAKEALADRLADKITGTDSTVTSAAAAPSAALAADVPVASGNAARSGMTLSSVPHALGDVERFYDIMDLPSMESQS